MLITPIPARRPSGVGVRGLARERLWVRGVLRLLDNPAAMSRLQLGTLPADFESAHGAHDPEAMPFENRSRSTDLSCHEGDLGSLSDRLLASGANESPIGTQLPVRGKADRRPGGGGRRRHEPGRSASSATPEISWTRRTRRCLERSSFSSAAQLPARHRAGVARDSERDDRCGRWAVPELALFWWSALLVCSDVPLTTRLHEDP